MSSVLSPNGSALRRYKKLHFTDLLLFSKASASCLWSSKKTNRNRNHIVYFFVDAEIKSMSCVQSPDPIVMYDSKTTDSVT
jgi:hypothetical protein